MPAKAGVDYVDNTQFSLHGRALRVRLYNLKLKIRRYRNYNTQLNNCSIALQPLRLLQAHFVLYKTYKLSSPKLIYSYKNKKVVRFCIFLKLLIIEGPKITRRFTNEKITKT